MLRKGRSSASLWQVRGSSSLRSLSYSTVPPQAVKVYVASTSDPLFNIATEEWIFREGDPTKQTLYLWRNSPTVVIGRHQNPFKECHLQNMEKDGVVLARRYSGGGAVYQDLGNTNFTFLSSVANYDKFRNTAIVTNALKKGFNVDAALSGRNDILVGGQKISGSAYKISGQRAMHHGTLLLNVDLAVMPKYLNPDKEKLKSKGVTSVQSRVTNLVNLAPAITHENVRQAVIEEFFRTYSSSCEIEALDPEKLKVIPSLNKFYESLKDWNWRYGETPHFEHNLVKRFDWGNMDINIHSDAGKILEVVIFSDSLFPNMIDLLTVHMKGKTYDKDGIVQAIQEVNAQSVGSGYEEHLLQLQQWLVDAI